MPVTIEPSAPLRRQFLNTAGKVGRVTISERIEVGRDQRQGVRGLDVIGGESIHRVTAAAFAAARPAIWPGGLHRAPAASAGCAAMRAP